ncbi:LysR family transcriptional regulator [Phytobacter massiliensis]|uniref:LysR family transcriptional regulator n=1 Tax=Phytobacter massiliensis TaxID=1485952 RepID=UPI003CC82D9B
MNTFLVAVRTGSLPATAGFLNVSQTCISSRLQTLENNIGFTLIQRGRHIRSVVLTEKGRRFFALSSKIMALLYEIDDIRMPLPRQDSHNSSDKT